MATQSTPTEAPANDYYQVFRLPPGADGAMVEQAYWRLARLYNAATQSDLSATDKLDELNEAYTVLCSPVLRREYDRVREGLPHADEPPVAPEREPAPPAIAARERQAISQRRFRFPNLKTLPWQPLASSLSVLSLAIVALITGAQPVLVVGLLIIAVTFTTRSLARRLSLPAQTETVAGRHQIVRPSNLGRVPVPGGRSQALRNLVYQVYEQFPHLGPGDVRAVARYTMLTQRFLRGERQLRGLESTTLDADCRNLAAEQRALAAELRRHEASLGTTAGARSSRSGTEPHQPPSNQDPQAPGH